MPVQQSSDTARYALIDTAAAGNNTLVAAVAGKKIRVLSFLLVGAGTVAVAFQSGAGGTALTGAMPLAASTVVQGAYNPSGLFETAAGVLLNLNLSAAIGVRGMLTCVEV
jgi:hypothetical protein